MNFSHPLVQHFAPESSRLMNTKFPIHLSTLLLSLLFACQASAEESLDHVTVTGKATIQVTPDEMTWNIQIKNTEKKLEAAAETHATTVTQVLGYLKELAIPPQDIQTSGMQFGESWTYEVRERVKNGYFASTNISFKVSDLSKYKELWIGISKLPHVSLTGVSYDNTRRIEFRNETRIKALRAAKSKAESLAEALGSKIGRPLSIVETSESYGVTSNFMTSNAMARAPNSASETTNLALGQIPINAQVKVTFLLITE